MISVKIADEWSSHANFIYIGNQDDLTFGMSSEGKCLMCLYSVHHNAERHIAFA